jgi:small-conductance mechanosensitive channel
VAASPVPVPVSSGVPTLDSACHSDAPGIVCRLAWDLSHSTHAADFTSVYLAGPIQLVLRIVLVLAIAVLLRIGARRLIRRITARAAISQDDADQVPAAPGGRRSQRASALASLLGNAASVAIFTIAGVIILGDIGLNLAPILASAGVLGIAIGFGAQNLVQDFLAGIFILMEDQYGVGDVVDIATVSGTVEAVSLRITRLRDVNGIVWHIRNGTIKRAGNETHGWARAVVDFPVPYGTPVAAARAALERAAIDMSREPRWRTSILGQPEVWGIETLSPDMLLVRVTARTAPQARPAVTRELRERLKTALDEQSAAGIAEMAIPRQPDGAGSAPAGAATAGTGTAGTGTGTGTAGTSTTDTPAEAGSPSSEPAGP